MKKTVILSAIAFLGIQQANAQMDDISVTLQPTASYNWFDDNTAIEDGVMVGGRVGFGFGEAIELRGLYEKSVDLKNTAEEWTSDNPDFVNNFNSRDVEVERIGGEFKANIPTRGSFVPYLTLGAGIQKLKVDTAAVDMPESSLKSEQIYANLGLGTQLKLSDRIFLNVEAKNTVFNMDPASILFQSGEQSSTEDLLGDDREDRMYNWSVLAGLQMYLGGREPGSMTDLDRAYYRKFSGGLSGLKLIIEPGGSYINFNDHSNLKNTYLLGGKIGFDLNQFIGLRGFYYQASKDDEISTDWDDLAIYGGDIVAKLNVSRGIVPYLELGGGYLNVYDSYRGNNPFLPVQTSGYFAKGGAGVSVPVSKNIELFGSASLMYTTQRDNEDLENLISPDELTQHNMYNAGVRFQLGGTSNTDDIVEDKIDARVKARTDVYEDRIDELEKELQKAYDNNDTKKAVEIIEEKKALEDKKVEEISKGKYDSTNVDESRVKLTPKELENLVEKVIQGVDEEEANKPQTTEDRIDRLERLLLEVNTGANNGVIAPNKQELANEKIISKLDQLNSKIENNANQISRLSQNQGQDKTVVVTQGGGTQPQVVTTPTQNVAAQPVTPNSVVTKTTTDEDGNVVQTNEGVATGFFVYEGMSLFGGFGFGEDSAGIIGIRGHYNITNSAVRFMPDIYVSPGEETGFGINANALLSFDQFDNNVVASPYIGLGLGYNSIGDFDAFGTNLIIGTSFNVLGGNLYADYTARNFVDIHQIAVGYKFGF